MTVYSTGGREDIVSQAGTASAVSYDNGTSGLAATNVQDAIDELVVGIPVTASQDSDLVITSDNVFQDTDLVIPLTAGTYAVEFDISLLSHATPDMEYRPVYTGTTTDVRHSVALWSSTGTVNMGSFTTLSTALFNTTASWQSRAIIHIAVSTAGDFKIQARQVTPSVTSVTFYRGSLLRITKLS